MRRRKATEPVVGPRSERARLARADRRDSLVDAAAEIVASGDVEAVSIENVAERAGVSRPLVYKHFANRDELLAAVYRRESKLLHREIAAAVEAADALDGKLRAFIGGALHAEAKRGATFAALRSAGVRNDELRDEQRNRDRTTVRYFASLAQHEYGIDPYEAREALSVILGAMTSVLAQWRRRPTPEHATILEDIYVRLAVGGLAGISQQGHELSARQGHSQRSTSTR